MVKLKPKSDRERAISTVNKHSFGFKHLLLFIVGSTLVHGLIFLLLIKYKATKLPVEETESEPIEFIVVPPEEETKEPPETEPEPIPKVAAKPVPEPKPKPEVATEVIPEPEPTSETEVAPEPESTPTPEPKPEPIPEPSANETISGADTPIAPPKPVEELATRLPPEPQPPEPSNPGGSAADLLGGDYQKTLANSEDAFFSQEALTYENVLTPQQLSMLKDFDIRQYQKKIKDKIRPHWNPNRYTSEEYLTVLSFKIQLKGQITELKIEQSSGTQEFDQTAMQALQKALPLAPLPADFPLKSLPYKFGFQLHK